MGGSRRVDIKEKSAMGTKDIARLLFSIFSVPQTAPYRDR